MVLALLFLVVAILSVVSVFRQIKFRNFLALGFSAIAAITFGFFSIATIYCNLATTCGA